MVSTAMGLLEAAVQGPTVCSLPRRQAAVAAGPSAVYTRRPTRFRSHLPLPPRRRPPYIAARPACSSSMSRARTARAPARRSRRAAGLEADRPELAAAEG
jgi:hypothetical protein